MALMKYWHKNDNLRMIYQLHFCFEGFRFWLYKQSTCIPDLFSSDFIISEMTLMKYSLIKCQSSHMKHIDIVKITIYLVKSFIHSIYPSIVYMYFTLCNGLHAAGIHMYKTQTHITIYNINKLMLSQFCSKPFSPMYMILPYDNPALVTCD